MILFFTDTKPLPELLVADNHGISLAELDNGLNFSQKVVQIPTKAFTFLAKTNFFFWVKNDTNLVMRDGKAKEINVSLSFFSFFLFPEKRIYSLFKFLTLFIN